MPYAEIWVTPNSLTNDEKTTLAQSITSILLQAENLPDNPISRSIALLEIKEFEYLFIGGKTGNQEQVVVKIYAFAEAFSDEIKRQLHAKINQAVTSLPSQKRSRVWCMILPLETGNFSVGGRSVTWELTKQLASTYQDD